MVEHLPVGVDDLGRRVVSHPASAEAHGLLGRIPAGRRAVARRWQVAGSASAPRSRPARSTAAAAPRAWAAPIPPPPPRPDLNDDVSADRCVQRVGVVVKGVAWVELVAVFAVDELLRERVEAGRVREREVIDEPGLDERPLDRGVPPDLGVVVAGQVDHPMPWSLREAPQRGKQFLVVGAGDRGGHSLLTLSGVPHSEQVEEVSGQYELDRSLVVVQVLQQRRELRGGLEDLAARYPADVGIRQENEQAVVQKLVPERTWYARRWIGGASQHASLRRSRGSLGVERVPILSAGGPHGGEGEQDPGGEEAGEVKQRGHGGARTGRSGRSKAE